MKFWDDEELAQRMGQLIYDRSSMTRGDADELAWDLMEMVKSELP